MTEPVNLTQLKTIRPTPVPTSPDLRVSPGPALSQRLTAAGHLHLTNLAHTSDAVMTSALFSFNHMASKTHAFTRKTT